MITATHPHDGAGFSRLGDLIPVTITVAHGSARAVWSARELEARLEVPGLARRLSELLSPTDIHSSSREAKRGFGGDVKRCPSSLEALNAFQNSSGMRSERLGNGEAFEGRASPARTTPVDNDIERIAAHLASALRDEKSIVFFRLVARAVPREVIRDALMRALDAQSVHRSRAALFAHIVRPHLPRRSFTNR